MAGNARDEGEYRMADGTHDARPVQLRGDSAGGVVAARPDPQRKALGEWFMEPVGQRVARAEERLVAGHLANLFGYNLLQVGVLPGFDLLANSRVLHRTVVDLGYDSAVPPCDSVVRGRASCLPVESDRMDVVVLPHVMEFEASPHEALREAARVLIPEGHLVLSSFSPLSLFGAWRLALRRRGNPPWNGHFVTASRMRDWLGLLGFELMDVAPLFFEPPVRLPRALHGFAVMEPAVRKLCPMFAGCHVMIARKRIATVTPIRPRFGYRRRLVGVSLAGPPARVIDRD